MKAELMGALVQAVLTMIFLSLGQTAEAEEKAPGITFYVSVADGDDRNPGSQEAPFQTLSKAQERVREAIAGGMSGDVRVLIRRGKYYLDGPLTFDERDSGRDGFRVVYQGYPNETAELIGGKRIVQWEVVDGRIYRADIGKGRTFHALFENGEWGTMARTPNEGYLSAAGADPKARQLAFREGDLPEGFDYRAAQVVVWAGYDEKWDGGKNYNWYATLDPIDAVDWASRTLTLRYDTFWELHEHNRYYVRGSRAFLDQPGEFSLDEAAGCLYYWPRTTPIEAQEIVAPTTLRVLDVQGRSLDAPAANLIFANLTLSQSDSVNALARNDGRLHGDGMIFLQNAENVTIRACRLRHAGLNAIALNGYNQGHRVRDNLIEGAGFCGIFANGYTYGDPRFSGPSEAYVNRNHTLTNNHLRGCGKVIGHGSGIWLQHCGDFVISHNLIEDMPRYGVTLAGTIYQELVKPGGAFAGRLWGQSVTWENHLDFVFARNVHVLFNEIRDVMKDSQDGGAIYTWGTGKGNRLENNFVHDLRTAVAEGSVAGIYLDDGSKDFTVKNNVVARVGGAKYTYPLIIKGLRNVVTNNVIADNDEAAAAIYVLQTPGWEEPVDELSFTRNVIVQKGGQEVYRIYPWKDTILRESDYNVFFYPGGRYDCLIDWRREPWEAWTRRLEGRYEPHTSLADPLFVDTGRLDYRVQESSPALEKGFVNVDRSRAGLQEGFPFWENVRKDP